MCLSALPLKSFKGRVHPKMNILSSYSPTNLYDFLFSVEHKRRYFVEFLGFSLHTMKVKQHLTRMGVHD